jgi:hypothetical protein
VLLILLAALRCIPDPLAPAAGLRASIELVIQSADLANIDPACAHRIPSILPDPALLRIVPTILQYVLARVETDNPAAAALPIPAANVVALGLPKANQVIALARRPDT